MDEKEVRKWLFSAIKIFFEATLLSKKYTLKDLFGRLRAIADEGEARLANPNFPEKK